MTRTEFDEWWRFHAAVAFPNVLTWIKNRCLCAGDHNKGAADCPSNAIKESWFGMLACVDLSDALAASRECQATVEFRKCTPQDHPAEVRSLAMAMATVRSQSIQGPTIVPLSAATDVDIANVQTNIKHAMRVVDACSQLRQQAVRAGLDMLPRSERDDWCNRIHAAGSNVLRTGEPEEYADRIITANREVYAELLAHLAGG